MTTNEMKPVAHVERMRALGVSPGTLEWAALHSSMDGWWMSCDRGDRMLGVAALLAGPLGGAHRDRVIRAAIAVARLVDTHDATGWSRACNAMTERYARRTLGVTASMVRSAARYRYEDTAAYDPAATSAAMAVLDPSDQGVIYFAECVRAVCMSVDRGAGREERERDGRTSADIVRRYYPRPPAFPRDEEY